MNEHPFNLQGDDYWTKPFKNDRALAEKTIFQSQPGLFIDGPPTVDLSVHPTIPIPVFSCLSQKDAYALPLMRHAFLVATRLGDRQTFTGFAVARDRPLPQTPPGAPADESAMMTESLLPDLKERLGLPAEPATYEVVLLLREHASNQVRVSVGKSGDYKDPEVEKFLQQQPLPPPAPVSPQAKAEGLPRYRRSESSPALPAEAGLALAAPRVTVLKPGAPLPVSGSFKAPVLKRELTGATAGNDDVTAIIPVTLVAFSSDPGRPGPFIMRLRVPTYDAVVADGVGTGYFAVDLLGLPGLPAKAATLFVYAFLGEWMTGPVQVALVTPDMLPK